METIEPKIENTSPKIARMNRIGTTPTTSATTPGKISAMFEMSVDRFVKSSMFGSITVVVISFYTLRKG